MEHEERSSASEGRGHEGTNTALKAAVAAAATGAAAMAAKKALSRDGGQTNGDGAPKPSSGSGSTFGSVVGASWEAARDALLPLAEDAAEAAGRYLGEKGPEFVRDRIVPRFISSFDAARS